MNNSLNNMKPIEQAIQSAKQAPNSQYANELRRRIEGGQLDKELSDAGLSQAYNRPTSVVEDTMGDISQVGSDIKSIVQSKAKKIGELSSMVGTGERNPIEAGFQAAGQVAGGISDIIGNILKGGVKVALNQNTENKVKEVVSKFGKEIVKNPQVQNVIGWYNELPQNAQDNIDAAGGIVSLIGDVAGLSAGKESVTTTAKTAIKGAENVVGTTVKGIKNVGSDVVKIGEKVVPKSPEIMNKVARLTPNQARQFEKLAGESHGSYLTRTGNFGTPQQIVENEANKFTQSLKSVDETLASLPGEYKSGVIDDALKGLKEKAIATSSDNVPSPILSRVNELINKNSKNGLTMSEINDVKRLYEREVKLGYNKLINADKVQTATNIDDALRKWQVSKAEELGFSNLKDLNKQTQISKALINSLGDQIIGKTGLNNISLTDWIMLSGGDPTAVGGFITKKFFSSKAVQAKIAKMLSDVKPEGIKKPIITPSKQLPPLQSKIVSEKALPKSSTILKKKSSNLSTLEQKAKKYKSAEEFVKALGNPERWVSDKPIKMPDIVYRGIGENGGTDRAMFGQGLYTAAKRSEAAKYGKVTTLGRESLPNNPLQFRNELDFSAWEHEIAKRLGLRRNTLYQVNEGVDNLVKSMGYDGISIGKGNDMIFVKFSDKPSTRITPPTKSQLIDIWNKANKK